MVVTPGWGEIEGGGGSTPDEASWLAVAELPPHARGGPGLSVGLYWATLPT